MVRERDLRLDVLKAAAIALVGLGHVITLVYGSALRAPMVLAVLFTLLSAVHVPLFVFVSGYLAPADADLKWLGRRAVRLLVPYFAWAALQWVAWFRGQGAGWFLRIAVSPGETNAPWFLIVLFELCALYVVVRRSTALMVGAALACLLVPPIAAPSPCPGSPSCSPSSSRGRWQAAAASSRGGGWSLSPPSCSR